jgi:hypothetical protein
VKLLGHMALVALVIGVSVTVAATGRVTLPLVISGAVGWGFVPVLQLMTGMLIVRGARGPLVRRLEGYFTLHWPWSVWIVAFHAALLLLPSRWSGLWLAATASVPILFTTWLLLAFCQQELSLPRRLAVRRVGEHQVVTYALVLAYVSVAIALWPRIVGAFE